MAISSSLTDDLLDETAPAANHRHHVRSTPTPSHALPLAIICVIVVVFFVFFEGRVLTPSGSSSCSIYPKSLPISVSDHQLIYHEAKHTVYLFGGLNNSICTYCGYPYLSKVYKWDLNVADSWFEEIGSTPSRVFHSSINNAVLIDDTIFFIGMQDTSAYPFTTSTIYTFDTVDEAWNTRGSVPWPRSEGCLATNNTHIFMVDGYSYDPPVYTDLVRHASVYVYDIAAHAWSSVLLGFETDSEGWYGQYCAVVDGSLFVWRGYSYRAEVPTAVYKLELTTLEVSMTDFGIKPRSDGQAVYYKGITYEVGGWPMTTTIYGYDFSNNERFCAATMARTASSDRIAIIEDKLFVFGAIDGDKWYSEAILNVIQVCDLNMKPPPLCGQDEQDVEDKMRGTKLAVEIGGGVVFGLLFFIALYSVCWELNAWRTRNLPLHVISVRMRTIFIAHTRAQHKKRVNCDAEEEEVSLQREERHDGASQQEEVVCDDEVQEWLEDTVNLPQYYAVFKRHGIEDLETVMDLNETHLQRMGIWQIGHQNTITKYARKIQAMEIEQEQENSVEVEGGNPGEMEEDGVVDGTVRGLVGERRGCQ